MTIEKETTRFNFVIGIKLLNAVKEKLRKDGNVLTISQLMRDLLFKWLKDGE